MVDYILALGGHPFTDLDAAEYKCKTLVRELGGPFRVINHPQGGYAVIAGESGEARKVCASTQTEEPPDTGYGPGPLAEALASFTRATSVTESQPGGAERETSAQGMPRYAPGAAQGEPPEEFQIHPTLRAFAMDFTGAAISFGLMVQPYLPLSLAGIVYTDSISTALTMSAISLTGLVLALFVLGRIGWYLAAFRYRVTPLTVKSVYGIIDRKSQTVRLSHVRSIDVEQTALQRLLGVGTVRLATGGTDDYEVVLRFIQHPDKLQLELQRRVGRFASLARRID